MMSGIHPNLAPYVLDGRPTGVQLGSGSYGTVEEVKVINYIVCTTFQAYFIFTHD